MFKVSLYGYSSDAFGSLATMDIENIDFEQLSSDNVAVIVIEDKFTSLKRYILGINTRTLIVRNEVLKGFSKAVTLHGDIGKVSWTHIVSYCDAEIFHISTTHMLRIVEMLKQDCASGKAFWYMNEKVMDYAIANNIACFTDIAL